MMSIVEQWKTAITCCIQFHSWISFFSSIKCVFILFRHSCKFWPRLFQGLGHRLRDHSSASNGVTVRDWLRVDSNPRHLQLWHSLVLCCRKQLVVGRRCECVHRQRLWQHSGMLFIRIQLIHNLVPGCMARPLRILLTITLNWFLTTFFCHS